MVDISLYNDIAVKSAPFVKAALALNHIPYKNPKEVLIDLERIKTMNDTLIHSTTENASPIEVISILNKLVYNEYNFDFTLDFSAELCETLNKHKEVIEQIKLIKSK